MSYKQLIILEILFFFISFGKIQNAYAQKPISCDCMDAILLNVNKTTTYGLTQIPEGFGKLQEITTNNKHSIIAFEKEHNTAWYLLSIDYSGELVFEIEPQDTTNDCDFLVYKYTDSSFCEGLLNKQNTPLRSNISRNSGKNKGITGLSNDAAYEFQGQGEGYPFSKSIQVKKGEKYMLVIDNISTERKGHKIYFNYLKPVKIDGIVLNSDSIPCFSEIKLVDNKGTVVKKTESNKNGTYEINALLKENIGYSLIYMNDSSFVSTATINTISLKKNNTFPNIKVVLPKLKKGNKYQLTNINFYSGLDKLLPESYTSIESIYHLLKKNRKMVIQIEGHVNAAGEIGRPEIDKSDEVFQKLSLARAMAVYDYLIKKGISEERIIAIGLGATEMIFPFAKNEKEASANRRVEIKVVSINGE
ncbi:MAG TPA: OmpA family protein [Bacteroidia bacterium]|jgi:outer membrane protein OmpA-like peptidoglycan-associated protein|nr:OmpA family protein [Bacteroidia bacterium]